MAMKIWFNSQINRVIML